MAELDVETLKTLVALRDELEVGAPGWLTASLAVARHVDAKVLAALEDRKRLRDDVEDYRQRLRSTSDAYNEVANDRDRLRAVVTLLQEAWAESWDCSRDPGHTVMNEAMVKVAALLDREV